MSTNPSPGLTNQSSIRTGARVLSVVLVVLGVFLLYKGITAFAGETNSISSGMDADDGGGAFGGILTAGAGGFCVVFGLAAGQFGWLGAGSRYVAGETMPVVKDSASYLTDGEGLAGIGRTVDDAPVSVAGPYCRSCGTRNSETARFCDSCGQSLV